MAKLNGLSPLKKDEAGVFSVDDDLEMFDGGHVAHITAKVKKAAVENRALLQSLMDGRIFIGEYNAQLALDNIKLLAEKKERSEELAVLKDQHEKLDARLNFIFEDCKRLSLDNDEIVKEGAVRDKELAELYSQLELQESKFRSVKKTTLQAQQEHDVTLTQKGKSQETYFQARAKLLRQHEQLWQTEDMVEYLKVEVDHLRKLLQAEEGKRLPPLGQGENSSGTPSQPAAGSGNPTQQVGVVNPNAPSIVDNPDHQGTCHRRDCEEIRLQARELQHQIHAVIREQRHRREQAMKSTESIGQTTSRTTKSIDSSAHAVNSTASRPLVPFQQGAPFSSTPIARATPGRISLSPSSHPIIMSPTSTGQANRRRLPDGRSPQ